MCYSAAGKVCVAIMIIVLMLIGLTFFIVGVFPVPKHVPDNYEEITSKTVTIVQYYFIASGLLALIVCALSMVGICFVLWWTESRCLFYWLALMVVLAIIMDIVLIIQVEKMKNKTDDYLSQKLPLYGVVLEVTKQIDFYQRKFQCCGVNGPEDYDALGKPVPDSCCQVPVSGGDNNMPGPKSYRFGDTLHARPYVPPDDPVIDTLKSRARKRRAPEPLETEPTYDEYIMPQGDGDYNVNVSTRIGYELPPKNITDTGPVGYKPSANSLTRCQGCVYNFLRAYRRFFFLFYFMVAAKILLQIAVGVSPCWVLLQDKLEGMEERPSDEDGVSVDTIGNGLRR